MLTILLTELFKLPAFFFLFFFSSKHLNNDNIWKIQRYQQTSTCRRKMTTKKMNCDLKRKKRGSSKERRAIVRFFPLPVLLVASQGKSGSPVTEFLMIVITTKLWRYSPLTYMPARQNFYTGCDITGDNPSQREAYVDG